MIEAVISYWDDHDVWYLPGVPEQQLVSFERRYGVVLPADVRAFYSRTDGTRVPLSSGQDHDSYEFWRLSDMVPDDKHPWAMNFADYRELSWWYAMDLAGHAGHGVGAVFFMGAIGGKPLVITHSFTEFLRAYLRGDERLFPAGAAKYAAATETFLTSADEFRERQEGDCHTLCELVRMIALFGDGEWLAGRWTTSDPNDSFDSLLAILFEDLRLAEWGAVPSAYLGLEQPVFALIGRLRDSLSSLSKSDSVVKRTSDLEILLSDDWQDVMNLCREIIRRADRWADERCTYRRTSQI